MSGIALDFLAQPLDVHRQGLGLAEAVCSPDAVKDPLLAQGFAAVLHQQPEEVELLGGEGQGPSRQGGGAALPVQGEVAVAQGGALVPPLKDAPDLGQEDVHVVGLFDVVVRPQAQPGQFVLLF